MPNKYNPQAYAAWYTAYNPLRPLVHEHTYEADNSPMCGDYRKDRHRLYLNPAYNQGLHCFKCGGWMPAKAILLNLGGGNVSIGLVSSYDQGISLEEEKPKLKPLQRPHIRGVLADMKYTPSLYASQTTYGQRILTYMEKRRVATRHKRNMGYFRHGIMANRLVMLIRDINDQPVYFVARDVTGKATVRYQYPRKEVVFGTAQTDVLYGLETCKDQLRIVLCEGVLSAISTNTATKVPAVASLGSEVSNQQARLLSTAGVKTVVYFAEFDQPSEKILKNCSTLQKQGLEVLVSIHKDKRDPNDMKYRDIVAMYKDAKSPMEAMITR